MGIRVCSNDVPARSGRRCPRHRDAAGVGRAVLRMRGMRHASVNLDWPAEQMAGWPARAGQSARDTDCVDASIRMYAPQPAAICRLSGKKVPKTGLTLPGKRAFAPGA